MSTALGPEWEVVGPESEHPVRDKSPLGPEWEVVGPESEHPVQETPKSKPKPTQAAPPAKEETPPPKQQPKNGVGRKKHPEPTQAPPPVEEVSYGDRMRRKAKAQANREDGAWDAIDSALDEIGLGVTSRALLETRMTPQEWQKLESLVQEGVELDDITDEMFEKYGLDEWWDAHRAPEGEKKSEYQGR